ncbi:MAG: nucleoside phosphorylase [Pseudomonadota bacterium]
MSAAGRIGVVCGLQSEARRLPKRLQGRVAVSGASAERAEAAAERLLAEGAERLLSFGVSGGLSVDAAVGDVIAASEVVAGDERWAADAAWTLEITQTIQSAGLTVGAYRLLGSDTIVGDVADKARLAAATGAFAVDMESHAVARVADRAGVPFAALRAVADPADRAIPAIAAYGVSETGETRAWPVLRAAAGRPGDLVRLMQVGADSAKALAALGRAVDALGSLAQS